MTNPEVAFAVYALAAVVFALPAYVAGVFAFAAVKAVAFVVKAAVAHFAPRPAAIEIVTPIECIAMPEGLTREEFSAWWDENVAPH